MVGPWARLWWGVLPLVALLWAVGALAPAALGVPAAPLLTQLLLPLASFATVVSLSLAVGAFLLAVLAPAEGRAGWAALWTAVALVLVLVDAVLLVWDVSASGFSEAASTALLGEVLTRTSSGVALMSQTALLVLALVLAAAWRSVGARVTALVLVCLAAAVTGLESHVGLTGQHWAAGFAVGVHVVAICLWVGGLGVVTALVLSTPSSAETVLPRFSRVALVCVIVAAEGGLLAATLVAGSLGSILGSTYGSMVILKAAVLLWLVRLGWLQRRRVIDLLPEQSTISSLARYAGTELLLMGALMAASVVLVRIGPPPLPEAGFAPLTLVALGLIAPLAIVAMRPRGWRVSDAVPEVTALLLLLVMFEVGAVGLLRATVGGIGLLLELALLLLVGWLASSVLRTPAGRIAWAILVVGLPVVMIATVILPVHVSWPMAVIATAVGELMLVAWWRGHLAAASAREARAASAQAVS